jgi:hypothetical protein
MFIFYKMLNVLLLRAIFRIFRDVNKFTMRYFHVVLQTMVFNAGIFYSFGMWLEFLLPFFNRKM